MLSCISKIYSFNIQGDRLNNFIFNEKTMWSVDINLYKNICQGPLTLTKIQKVY